MIYLDQQLRFLLWLKELRGPILDQFFLFLNWFDSIYFLLAVVSLIWLGFSRKLGIRAAYFATFAAMSSIATKYTFALPRPCYYIPDLCLLDFKFYGFPSGGAQNAMIIAGFLILYWKNSLRWPIAILYFSLISFSRMYLGVHFPLDILGGWILGLITLIAYYFTVDPIEAWTKKHLKWAAILSILVPFVLWMLLFQTKHTFGVQVLTALGLGIFLSRYFHQIPPLPQTMRIALIRGVFGVLSTLAIFIATKNAFLTYLWISWLGGLTFLPESK